MKKLKYYAFSLAFLFVFNSCKKTKYDTNYNKKLIDTVSFDINYKLFDKDVHLKKIDTLNFYKFIGEETKFYYKNNSIKSFLDNKKDRKILYYGETKINQNNFYLFSIDEIQNGVTFEKTGYLVINNNTNNKHLFLKVFNNKFNHADLMMSYFSNNYLLIFNDNDESFDVADDSKQKTIKRCYCVVKILGDGNIVLLDEVEGNKIFESEFNSLE